MRVSTNGMYTGFVYNQKNTFSNLTKTTDQLSSGLKISKMSDDPRIFTDTLRLDNESSTLQQVVKTAQSSRNLANNTDTTINDMVTTITSFKTKLLQSASAVNNDTNDEALANDLQGLRDHLQQLANTSINGKFLFSGTDFNTKPFDNEGNYHGNDRHIKAKLGSKVDREYNIDGATLFQGIDEDYTKHIETNVKHFDVFKEHPEFIVQKDGKYYVDKNIKEDNQSSATNDYPTQTSLSPDAEIRQLTGVSDEYHSDTDSYTDGTSYFYIKGRKPTGETFSTKFALTNSAKIDDLLTRIGKEFGNTAKTKTVDVTMNKFGQISIKDRASGKMVTDFNMVASDKDESGLDDVVKNGDYAVSFTKSKFASLRDISEVSANNKSFDNRVFSLNSEFRTIDKEEFAKHTDKLKNILNKDISSLHLTGKDTDGNDIDETLNIDDTTTMQDLMDNIKDNFGDVDVSLDHGILNITDKTIEKDEKSNVSFKMEADDSNGNAINSFARMDGISDDKTKFQVDGRKLISNVPQIDKNSQLFATENTKLVDVSGKDDIDGKELNLNYTDKNGNIKHATVTLRDTADSDGHLSTFTVDGNTYDIFDNEGNKTPIHDVTTITTELDPSTCKLCNKEHTIKGFRYKQLNDVIGMLVSGNIPANNDVTSYKNAIADSEKDVNVKLDNGKIAIEDKNNATTKMQFEMHDADTDSYNGNSPVFTFNSNDALTIDRPKVDIFHQLDDIIKSVRDGKMRADGDDETDPRNTGIENGLELIDHIADHINKSHTKIGAISKSLEHIQQRNEILVTHVDTLKSQVLDVDVAAASMRLQQLKLNYQAMLASIAKVNSLSLVNYMR